ncbi:MAG: threonine ammonia-lyase [Nocardioides sp.]
MPESPAVVTPVIAAHWLSERLGVPVLLKCENLQRTGSFKIRGAFTRISRLSAEERSRGVVAASAGNHAQGVALAAQQLGIECTVFMPEGAPIPKVEATESYGARVVLQGRYLEDCLLLAGDFAAQTGAILIHPFDHPDIIEGQSSAGVEILEQIPDVRTVLVPTGGGGLIGGVARVIKAHDPTIRVVGVQAEQAAAFPASLAAGAPIRLDSMSTMADGIAVGRPGDLTLPLVRAYVDEIRTVSEESLSQALLQVVERAKLVTEPAGAAAVAALIDDPEGWEGPVCVVLSGGNLDPLLLGKVVAHGMAAAGRYLALRVTLPDLPGGLASLLGLIADAGANVVDVAHARTSARLHLAEVEVLVQLETRGPEHAAEVESRLVGAGYRVRT